jgi:catechol-2,3-dioxygenase
MSERKIKALGEIALRVNDLDLMQKFYEKVIGLELMRRFPKAAFFKVAEGYAGHFAFTIAASDYESEKRRLEGLGLEVSVAEHPWVQWRSLYVRDPEGNEVELVCYDPTAV